MKKIFKVDLTIYVKVDCKHGVIDAVRESITEALDTEAIPFVYNEVKKVPDSQVCYIGSEED